MARENERAESLIGLRDCEALACDHGGSGLKFLAFFPAGPMECQWLDPYLGLFTIAGATGDGFTTTADIAREFPGLMCVPTFAWSDA